MLYRIILLCFLSISVVGQPLTNPDAAEILHKLQKLKVLGSALYVAAHPDDENTRLIAWLANEKKVQTAYLAMTRGDGGQNLIGPEIREKLGIIRTQELLAARRIDGGEQFFTRANDFGYSKSPEETLEIWDEDKILSDVVWTIRKFRPDIIITRFPTNGYGGHGHHTASAMLAHKAFELAGDPEAYPEQLKYVDTWQPKRLFLNTGRWWSPNITDDKPGVVSVNVGTYNQLLGTSYTEMAARSRSMHKSQGFGATGSRGIQQEFLEYRLGDKVDVDPFEGIDMSWSSIDEEDISNAINHIIESYEPLNPAASIESLLELRKNITKINNDHWKEIKLNEVDEIVKDMLGFYMEATTPKPYLIPGESFSVNIELANRSNLSIIGDIYWNDKLNEETISVTPHGKHQYEDELLLPKDSDYTIPYWLENTSPKGYYTVNDQQLIGKPENDQPLTFEVKLTIEGQQLSYEVPLYYKWNDPVKGELRRPVAIVPEVSVDFTEELYLFPDKGKKEVKVRVKNYNSSFQGDVMLQLPKGWETMPQKVRVSLNKPGEEKEISFDVMAPKGQQAVIARIMAQSEGKVIDKTVDELNYDHIPSQTLISLAKSEFVKLNVNVPQKSIGYIEGAGDAIPEILMELGYRVDLLTEDMADQAEFSQYDAIILGIRALNTNERIDFIMPKLFEYTKKGGVVIIQYNTSHRLKTNNLAPYPLQLSRDRVTVEDAPLTMLSAKHPALNTPNKITAKDFEGWVQERGLYFPSSWGKEFVPLFSMNDPGEGKTKGSMLVAPYGEGFYVYTGISFFRQLPAGVPGAIRLFVNLISLGDVNNAGN